MYLDKNGRRVGLASVESETNTEERERELSSIFDSVPFLYISHTHTHTLFYEPQLLQTQQDQQGKPTKPIQLLWKSQQG